MAQIGTLGDLVFEVSDETVRTFDEFVQTTASRWVVHEPINSNTRPEFLGPQQGSIEFTIRLAATLGVNPRDEKDKVEALVREGKHAPLMIAQRPISDGDWYIESCETTLIWVNRKGQVEYADMLLFVKEYF
jgi:hypothetical protein